MSPPDPEHVEESNNRNSERRVAAQEHDELVGGGWFAHEAFVERDGEGETFVVAERLCGVKADNVIGNLRCGIAGAGAVDTSKGIGANVCRVAGQHNAGT